MIKETHVQEKPFPPGCRPWEMAFERDTETDDVTVAVKGNSGGIKARFRVSYPELKEAVKQLE
jgi:hypothetical protein